MISTKLENAIRDIADFPKPGIVFKDITPILKDASLCREVIDEFVNRLDGIQIDVIAGIESSLPRLRGRLVIRIATARAEQSKAQVEAIINSQTEQELRQRIDADFHLRIAELNAQFASRLSILKYVPGGQKQLHLRSWNDGVELSIGHSPRQDIEHLKNRPAIGKSVEVWLRRNDNLVANETMTAILLSKAPAWLSTYFSENPLFLSPDEHKWGIEFGEKWVVLKLP